MMNRKLDEYFHCTQSTKEVIIVCEENGKRFTYTNPNKRECRKIHIDGCLIKQNVRTKRCDFAILVPVECMCFLIELKGKRINHAFEQIDATLDYFYDELKKFRIVNARIIAKNSKPDYYTSDRMRLSRRLKNDFNGNLVCENGENYTEPTN